MNEECAKALNELARQQNIYRILKDIAIDLAICEIEGWSSKDYIDSLIEELSRIREKLHD